MRDFVRLTNRESEITEMIAWGASKKEIADQLCISERTVENHIRNVYDKTGCCKVNELSAWWFCTRFNISFSLSPLKRKMTAFALLLFILPQMFSNDFDMVRVFRTRTQTVRTCRVRRRTEGDDDITPIIL